MADSQVVRVGKARAIVRRRLGREIYEGGVTHTSKAVDGVVLRALDGICGDCKNIVPIKELDERGVQTVILSCEEGLSPFQMFNGTPVGKTPYCAWYKKR